MPGYQGSSGISFRRFLILFSAGIGRRRTLWDVQRRLLERLQEAKGQPWQLADVGGVVEQAVDRGSGSRSYQNYSDQWQMGGAGGR